MTVSPQVAVSTGCFAALSRPEAEAPRANTNNEADRRNKRWSASRGIVTVLPGQHVIPESSGD